MRVTLATGTPAELALPTSGVATRGLVLWPDIMGLRPLFDDHCERLANELGWAVCAPEPFPGLESMPLDERLAYVGNFDDQAKLADAVAAADTTGANPVGVIGFCMGGMYALKCAASDRFDRVVGFYGMIRMPEAWEGPGQGDALDAVRLAPRGKAMAIIGTADQWTPASEVDDLEAVGAMIIRYEGADHGFVHAPDRDSHRPVDAADAWSKAIAFLAT